MKKHILDNDISQWKIYLKENNFPIYRASQIFDWLHNKMSVDLSNASNLPKVLIDKIQEDFEYNKDSSVDKRISQDSEKILWDVNNRKIESVLLKYEKRNSVCVSVQSGCSLNCSFCATGKLNFTGNLSVGEILEQVYYFQREFNLQDDANRNKEKQEQWGTLKTRISNIVYMGMGEPFYNYENTIRSAQILSSKEGLDIANRKITISTVGVLPELKKFVEEKHPFSLALSVHAVDSKKRMKLMEVEKKYPLEEITNYLAKHRNQLHKNQLTFEYIMIQNFNMKEQDAISLGHLAKKLRAKVNLIPINTNFENYIRPNKKQINQFWSILNNMNVVAINRGSTGLEIDGACGMLAAKNK